MGIYIGNFFCIEGDNFEVALQRCHEVKSTEITKYYTSAPLSAGFAGASRIAMRKYTIPQSMSVEYFLTDHLGSTSMTTNMDGGLVSEMRYKPWGEVRYAWTANQTTTPAYELTRYTFTGQYSYMDDITTQNVTEGFGLMYYNARMYDPALGRFTSADTIIPSTQGVQAWDRFAYTNNNPVRYTDPSGHGVDCGLGESCVTDPYTKPISAGNTVKPPASLGNDNKNKGDEGEDNGYSGQAGVGSEPATPTPCIQALISCLPTLTPTPTPYSGHSIGTPDTAPSNPKLRLKLESYIDWTKVDGIDFAIDLAGITGDIAYWTGIGMPFYIGTEIAEGAGLIKGGADLIFGDPSNALHDQTITSAQQYAKLFWRAESLVPWIGFVGNAVSMYLNVKPQINFSKSQNCLTKGATLVKG
jgi:RHS repeat-associated protein